MPGREREREMLGFRICRSNFSDDSVVPWVDGLVNLK